MILDSWLYRFKGYGFYAGCRLGRLLLGVSSEGLRDFEVGIEIQWTRYDRFLWLKFGWVYFNIVWDSYHVPSNSKDSKGTTGVDSDSG
jgi:hypothetical protein